MSERWAFVTGTDRGLGRYLALSLKRRGWSVFAGVLPSGETGPKEKAEGLLEIPCDIGSDESVSRAAAIVTNHTARLDLLINNAGVLGEFKKTIFDELDFEEMQRIYNINALGPLRVTKALLPLLLVGETKTLVNISSEAGSLGTQAREGWFAYCLSKAALNMETVLLSNSLKSRGVSVVSIHPGWLQTEMRGYVDAEAPLTAELAAEKILDLIFKNGGLKPDGPRFVDNEGNSIPF